MRWSDGTPFTSEDFRFYWEDIATNETLSPFGPAKDLLSQKEKPVFEVIDEYTVKYSWNTPNPYFYRRWLVPDRCLSTCLLIT
ncbi:ABC transporter substrate-binding protein [Aliamphritea spongicola]|nr:ABC transporter substrate-binding protein [Aliamphritea spongicola]